MEYIGSWLIVVVNDDWGKLNGCDNGCDNGWEDLGNDGCCDDIRPPSFSSIISLTYSTYIDQCTV